MIHELPWLPSPTPSERDELQRLNGREGLVAITRLAKLSELRWNVSEFGSIGRKLRKFLQGLDPDYRSDATKAGLSPLSLLIFASNTAVHLVEPLMASALARGILLECQVVEYQEPEAWLAENSSRLAAAPPDATLISLDRNSLRLKAMIGNSAEAEACVRSAVDRVVAVCNKLSEFTGSPVIIENLPADWNDPQGSIDAWVPGSPRLLATTFNHRLAALAPTHPHLLFDIAGIADLVGQPIWSAGRYWYTAKLPFSPTCIPLYAQRFVTLLASLRGKSRRVLVLDLDNTLWGGVIGDDGVDGIVLGGTNALGKAYVAVQKMALHYKERGILLCIASKNTREIALEAFRRHPEMVLRESDITLFNVNWENKASNIRAMSETLNLGLEAFVLIDDNPVERKQVRDAAPGVAVPELPEDPSAWLPVMQGAAYFEQQSLSEEDLKRADYYKGNIQRAVLQGSAGDEKKFLESLQMVMTIAPFEPIGRKRIAQLAAKSNQFNLTTRRYSEVQIAEFETDPSVVTFQIRLTDIFGDNGMISVIICRKGKTAWDIDTWLMSCRVVGRGVERVALGVLAERARNAGVTQLRGRYIPTAKNGMVRDHYAKLGFAKVSEVAGGESAWSLNLDEFVPQDVPIKVVEDQVA